MRYEASRLSQGNSLFPAEITLGQDEVKLKIPGLFEGKEKSLFYKQITSIEINGGALSFCEIVIKTSRSGKIIAKGFSHITAKEIQSSLQKKIEQSKTSNSKNTASNNNSNQKKSYEEAIADAEYTIKDIDSTLDSISDDEISELRKYYKLSAKSEMQELTDDELSDLEVLKITTNSGTPSSYLRMELEMKGLELKDVIVSNISISNIQNSKSKKESRSLNSEISDDETIALLKKHWKIILGGFIGFMVLIYFLKQNETTGISETKKIHQSLESTAIDIDKLIKAKNYDKALELTKDLNHPDHIIFDSKGTILSPEYYDNYWEKYKDSIKTVILKKIK
jgi:hypothetical protein